MRGPASSTWHSTLSNSLSLALPLSMHQQSKDGSSFTALGRTGERGRMELRRSEEQFRWIAAPLNCSLTRKHTAVEVWSHRRSYTPLASKQLQTRYGMTGTVQTQERGPGRGPASSTWHSTRSNSLSLALPPSMHQQSKDGSSWGDRRARAVWSSSVQMDCSPPELLAHP